MVEPPAQDAPVSPIGARLRLLSFVIALLLALGEAARWWGSARMVPLAFDEWLVAGALAGAAWIMPRRGTGPLAAAWGLFSGLMLGLLIPTLDHLLFGPEKANAAFYAIILAVLLALGLLATARSIALIRAPSRSR
jgi:hypothetical protein